jgi:hypothetical protein
MVTLILQYLQLQQHHPYTHASVTPAQSASGTFYQGAALKYFISNNEWEPFFVQILS